MKCKCISKKYTSEYLWGMAHKLEDFIALCKDKNFDEIRMIPREEVIELLHFYETMISAYEKYTKESKQ